MTALTVERRTPHVIPVLGLALFALATRGVGLLSFAVPVACAVGVLLAQPAAERGAATRWFVVTAAGMSVFTLVRLALPGAPVHATTFGIAASIAAAIGEEIVFRRGLYGVLERFGPAIAIVITALVFGLVHAPMYGWSVVPVDVGAGLVLGWQRMATGSWTSSAATHAFANVLGAL